MKSIVPQEKPQVTEGFLRYLKEVFPISDFKKKTTERELAFYQGVHSVIDHLEHLYIIQQKDGPNVSQT